MQMKLNVYLTVDGAAEAIAFYRKAFDAEEIRVMPAEEDGKIMHAELKLFGEVVMLADAFEEFGGVRSPVALGGTTFNMMIGLDKGSEVDPAMAKAAAAGAEIVTPAEDMFWGDRFGMVRDPFGHLWAFAGPQG